MVRRGEGSVIKTVIGGGGKGIGQTEQRVQQQKNVCAQQIVILQNCIGETVKQEINLFKD